MENTYCLLCNSTNSTFYISLTDRLQISNDIFQLKKCECGFIYLNPRPNFTNIKKYYHHIDYDPYNVIANNYWNKCYKIFQHITNFWKKTIISKHYKKGNLLDIGGGGAHFARFMKSKNWEVSMQDSFSKFDKINLSVSYIRKLENIEKGKKFNVITLWHSLEHIHSIDNLFIQLRRLITGNGILIIAVPNLDAIERKYFKEHWAPYDAPRHLYHFTLHSLKILLEKNGFTIIEKKSLYQDIPYNILLSINKYSIINIIRSLIIFLFSMFLTILFGPKQSSSFLVICQKK